VEIKSCCGDRGKVIGEKGVRKVISSRAALILTVSMGLLVCCVTVAQWVDIGTAFKLGLFPAH